MAMISERDQLMTMARLRYGSLHVMYDLWLTGKIELNSAEIDIIVCDKNIALEDLQAIRALYLELINK